LNRNKGLKHLDLSKTGFTAKTGTQLLTWLGSSYQVRRIDMSDNKLDSSVGHEIAKFMRTANGLTSLNISNTRIGSSAVNFVCEALTNNKSLRELYLNGNPFDKKGGEVILESLKVNVTLQKLGIANCQLGKDLVIKIAKTMNQSKLRYLDLSETPEFKDRECVIAWKDTLASSACILEEFICQASLNYEAMKDIMQALETNKSLKSLDLSRNKIGGKAGGDLKPFAQSLQKNATLETLILRGTEITSAAFKPFIETLDGKNRTLKTVIVGDNGKEPLATWNSMLGNYNLHFSFSF